MRQAIVPIGAPVSTPFALPKYKTRSKDGQALSAQSLFNPYLNRLSFRALPMPRGTTRIVALCLSCIVAVLTELVEPFQMITFVEHQRMDSFSVGRIIIQMGFFYSKISFLMENRLKACLAHTLMVKCTLVANEKNISNNLPNLPALSFICPVLQAFEASVSYLNPQLRLLCYHLVIFEPTVALNAEVSCL